MSYREAFEWLKSGDFHAAVPLLEKAVHETGFSSEVVNHAYTLALHYIGDKAALSEVAFRMGASVLEKEPAVALDYFQRSLYNGLDADRVRQIGEIFEKWAAEVPPRLNSGPITRVAHVLGCVLPGHAPTQYVKLLCSSLMEQGIESIVFSTEWAASWFFNPEGIPQSQDVNMPAPTVIASVEGDFIQRAERVSESIRRANVQAVFYHASLSEQITACVAASRPAPIQVNVNHGTEMDAALFDGRIHLFRNGLERSQYRDRLSEWIPLVSDIELRLKSQAPATRAALGIEAAKTVSATVGNMYKVAGAGYLETLVEILKRFPDHYHLFAGAGNVKDVRAHLHSADVLSRVRFLAHMPDVAPLMNVVDVYLASYPHSGGHSILEAMGAGKPVVVLGHARDSHYNSGAELVGVPELIARNKSEYVDIADKLIRLPDLRAKYAARMQERFQSEFRPSMLGFRYAQFLSKI